MKIKLLVSSIVLIYASLTGNAQVKTAFSFGTQNQSDNAINIQENIFYSNELGYGFDFENANAVKVDKGSCFSDLPFYFSLKVPEGTYEVNITFGATNGASETTVKAESRRLMLHKVTTNPGETIQKSITVNVRSIKIDDTGSIRLKSRELNYLNWDNKLTLEFSGKTPAIQSIEIKPKENYTTLFLAGNSTVTDQDLSPWASWGQMITNYFNTDISVANYAASGASLASFKDRGRLDKILSLMKPNDFIFIEFGHNDQKRKGDGIGPWLSFTDLLKEFITRSREKGGIPVLVTPTQRRSFNDEGVIVLTHGDYPDAMRKVAKDMDVPLIDVHAMTKVLYEKWEPKESTKAFVHYPANTFPGQEKALADNTHFNEFGANEIASCVLKGIVEQQLPLKAFLINPKFAYSPEHPNRFANWDVPMSPRFESTKPDGN